MAMEQVKQREFVLHFGDYKDREVEIVNKNEIVGVYTPASLLSKEGITLVLENAAELPIEEHLGIVSKKMLTKKEATVMLAESIRVTESLLASSGLEPVPTDSTKDAIAVELEGGVVKRDGECLRNSEIVGNCDICGNPSKELWEHEEEGIERNVCRNCFAVRFDTLDKLEKFLSAKKKVEFAVFTNKGKSWGLKAVGDVVYYNPIPKPVKKEKKKSY